MEIHLLSATIFDCLFYYKIAIRIPTVRTHKSVIENSDMKSGHLKSHPPYRLL